MAGAGPWEAGKQHVDFTRRVLYFAAKNAPTPLRVFTDALVATIKKLVATQMVTRRIDAWLDTVTQKDEAQLTVEERREHLLRMVFDGFAQGAKGAVHETRLLVENWGFKFEDVDFDKIQLWYVWWSKRHLAYLVWHRAWLPRLSITISDES